MEHVKKALAQAREEKETCLSETSAIIERLVRDNAVWADQERRRQLAHDSATIGRIVTIREGMSVYETFEDGTHFAELRRRQSDLKGQKDALEKAKKDFTNLRRKQTKARAADEDDGFKRPMDIIVDEDMAEQDEIFKLRAVQIKKVSGRGGVAFWF